MTKIKIGSWVRVVGPGGRWDKFFEVASIDGDLVQLYTSDKKMNFTYTIRDFEWEIKPSDKPIDPADIDHFEYDGYRTLKRGDWYGDGKRANSILCAAQEDSSRIRHIYRPILKVVLGSVTPLTDKFEEEGW